MFVNVGALLDNAFLSWVVHDQQEGVPFYQRLPVPPVPLPGVLPGVPGEAAVRLQRPTVSSTAEAESAQQQQHAPMLALASLGGLRSFHPLAQPQEGAGGDGGTSPANPADGAAKGRWLARRSQLADGR